jgi:hypothetical protein
MTTTPRSLGRTPQISPALTGRLHSLASDLDGAVAAAEMRLNEVLDELRDSGIAARESVERRAADEFANPTRRGGDPGAAPRRR